MEELRKRLHNSELTSETQEIQVTTEYTIKK